MRGVRVVAPPLAAVLAAVGLAACGGGGSSTSTPAASAASTPATTPSVSTPATTATATTPTAATKPAETAPRPSTSTSSSSSSSSGGSGGGAAGFRATSGDNSIPNYGSEAPPSERERATAALAGFLRARASGEWPKACTYLAVATRTQLERLLGGAKAKTGGCAQVLAQLSKDSAASHAETLTLAGGVAALRIKGTSAFALFHGPKGSKYVMPMRNEGGAWKMSQLAPLPYPLGSAGATP
jgi:hypothetical protein